MEDTNKGKTALASLLVLIAGAVCAQNLVVNPGFESGQSPWIDQGGYVTTQNPRSGSNSFRISQSTAGWWKVEQQDIVVESNKTYDVSLWVRTQDVADHVMFLVELFNTNGVRLVSYWDSTQPSGTTPYTKLDLGNQVFIPPYVGTLTMRLFFWQCAGTAWIDDASVTATGTESNPPYCRLTSPSEGQVFPIGSNIPLAAEGWDEDGIANIQFLYTDHWLNKDYSAPYTDTLNSAAEGSYAFKAVLTDTTGRKCVSELVNVTVSGTGAVPSIAVSRGEIAVSCEEGEDAGAETFDVWNSGTGTLLYNVLAPSSKLDVAPTNSSSTGVGDKTTHTVTFNTSGLTPGVYDRLITVEDAGSGAANSPVTIDVEITVTAASTAPIEKGAVWRWRKGSVEASAPAGDWRERLYDDAAWATNEAPFGYASGGWPTGTEITDMKTNYMCVFMRRPFTVAQPALVEQLSLDVDFDDGFIAWVNGEEVARVNMAGSQNDFQPFDTNAAVYVSGGSSNVTLAVQGGEIPALAESNVLAVQVFNVGPASSDLMMDAELTILLDSLSAGADADGDVLPDAWETNKLGNTNANASADGDTDGVSNIGEYIGGTHPAQSNDYFAVSVVHTAGTVIVSFPTVNAAGAGYDGLTRYYALEARPLSGVDGWAPVPDYDRKQATGGPISYTNALSEDDPLLFRGRAWLE